MMATKLAKTEERQEIDRFLDLLEKRLGELSRSTFVATEGITHEGQTLRFSDYLHTRDLSSECWAFSIIIERRIENYKGAERETLRTRFEILTVNIWATLLSCSLKFLDILSRQELLPLGSREVFIHEIKTLYDAHKLLDDPRYATRVDEALRHKQRQAERILTEVIERAPTLLNFGP